MMRRTKISTVIPFAILTSCSMAEDVPDLPTISTISQAAKSVNRLTENRLTENSLSMNRLTENRLTENSLTLNRNASSGLVDSEGGRELLTYIVKCALREGDVLVVSVPDENGDGVTHYSFPGLLGLAPDWIHRALVPDEREALSACLLSHVNHYAVSVPISVRVDGVEDVTPEEMERYMRYEGAFFGNLFGETQRKYACWGDSPPDFSVSYPDHDKRAGDRLLRRCSDEDPDNRGTTICGFTYLGACSEVCDSQNGGSYSDCWTDRNRTGDQYSRVMSVWLLEPDDADGVWTEHYDEVYGP